MKPETILRLVKAGIFILVAIFFGLSSGFKSQVLFAVVLAMYLIELYRGKK